MKEAEEYAKTVLGLEEVCYVANNFTAEYANFINKSIEEVYNKFGNLSEMGVLKSIRLLDDELSAYAEYSYDDKSISVQNLPNVKVVKEQAQACFEAGYWSTGETEHFIRHELGHAIECYYGATKRGKNRDIADKIAIRRKNIEEEIGMEDWNQDDIEHFKPAGEILSYYALWSEGEFVAESVAEYMAGNPRETALWIVDMIRKEAKL